MGRPKQEFCKNGHPRTPENLTKNLACKICTKERRTKYYKEHRDVELERRKMRRLGIDIPNIHKKGQKFCRRGHLRIPENLKGSTCILCIKIVSKERYKNNREVLKKDMLERARRKRGENPEYKKKGA